jgi:hypothetical protein
MKKAFRGKKEKLHQKDIKVFSHGKKMRRKRMTRMVLVDQI